MMPNHVNQVLRNSEAVSRRAEESRREIAVLRAEYERLLERGLQAGSSNVTDTDKEMVMLNKRDEREIGSSARTSGSNQTGSFPIANSDVDIPKLQVKKKQADKVPAGDSARTALDQGSPPKVRHYNVQDAREYIRKQKERRLQQQKQQKDTDNVHELKRQKLKDLHQKSLQIVARNRQRSKSKDQQNLVDVKVTIPESVQNTILHPTKKPLQSLPQPSTATTKQGIVLSSTANITIRGTKNKELHDTKYRKASAKSDDAKIKAATLIQAYFRGHIQRKLYKSLIKEKFNQQETFEPPTIGILASENIIKIDAGNCSNVIGEQLNPQNNAFLKINVMESVPEKKIPEWLQLEPDYHPYNFINSVKRKLSFALSTPVKTSDIGIQSSFSEHFPVSLQDKQQEGAPIHSYKNIKEKIANSLCCKDSDREINVKIGRSLEAFRDTQREQISKLSSKQSLSDHSKKYKHIVKERYMNGKPDDKGFLDLDVKKLEKLRLQNDHSDSDTSNNIPDISIESHLKSSSTTVSTSDSHTSIFKLPREAPPKPKRLSRHDIHTSSAKFSSDNESQKYTKHAQEHLDEYKLDINVDRIKDIKLRMRADEMPLNENTMMLLERPTSETNTMRQSNEVKTDVEIGVLQSSRGSSSSINTALRSQSIYSPSNYTPHLTDNEEKSKNTIKSKSQVSLISSANSDINFSNVSVSSKGHSDRSHSKSSTAHHVKSDSASEYQNSQKTLQTSRRDSTISGNITRYTKSFDSYNSINSKEPKREVGDSNETIVTADETDKLQSFHQYMKEMDDTQKITHTPFQPKGKAVFRNFDADKRLQEVISKVNLLDVSRNIPNSAPALSNISIVKEQEDKLVNIQGKTNSDCNNEDQIETIKTLETGSSNQVIQQNGALGNGLKAPDVNLIVMKCNDINEDKSKLSAAASADTLANVPGPTNQIHVKFEAEIHMLNDFNESLKHVMNIEKSMLELQTKYNLQPTIQQTKDTQTSIMSSTTKAKSQQNSTKSRSSLIENSINFSRGSDIEEDIRPDVPRDDSIMILHQNKNLKLDSTGSNSTLNISDILNDSNFSMLSKQNAITPNTSAKQLSTTDMANLATSWDKHRNVGVSLGMFDELIRDEDARIDNLKTELKIREKALLDRTKAELTWLEIQKKHLLESGKLHEASLLKKKQRGIILKLQEEKNEMQRLREAQKAASRERKTKLKEQRALIKAQLSGPHLVTRIRRASERRASGPVKVYQSEYYQSETSISRKSSAESVVYSASASIVSRGEQAPPDCDEHVTADAATDVEHASARVVPNCTEMAKRSLQMREAALQRRKKEAEELLRWHQRLLREERKIAELEMAASNVINQVPVTNAASDGGGDKYAYNVGAVITPHMIWKSQAKTDGVIQPKTCKGKTKQVLESGADASMSSKYSTEFEADIGKDDDVLEKESIPQSESTLNEIMQNINNITDEISELYKLSSFQKTSSQHDSIKTDNIPTEVSQSEKRSTQVSIISKPNTVPDATNVDVVTQDNSSVHVSGVADTTGKLKINLFESNIGNESNKLIIRVDSQQLSLHEIQLPDSAETDDDVSSLKSDVYYNEETVHISKTTKLISKDEVTHNSNAEVSDASDTLIETKVEDLQQVKVDESSEQISDVKTTEISQSDLSAKEIEDDMHNVVEEIIVEISPNISNKNDTVQDQSNISTLDKLEDNPILSQDEYGFDKQNLLSSKDISITSDERRDVDVEVSLVEIVEADDLLSYHLPSSKIDTLLEVPEQQGMPKNEEDVELSELKDTLVVNESELSQDELIKSAIYEEETEDVSGGLIESAFMETPEVSSVSSEKYDVEEKNISINHSEKVDFEQNDLEHESTEIHSKESEVDVQPIIDIKIQEKKNILNDTDQSPPCLDLGSSTKEVDESVEEDLNTSEPSIVSEKDDACSNSSKSDSKGTINVKKRVSEILADANLNASIEEKSPRLPDIYVTTYDVISPENSPELGSPVDNAKVKPKDIYGIGNEAQELLRKQLAIEQEIKQIERQQKEQLPYIFVREIPNKPPPPYTPPVQQPISIIPATPAQIEVITPYLAEIFYRGFVEKTLEYVTFPDITLDQLETVDKICAEFVFDIAKDYAIGHYKQFVEPDEKAPSWMKHNKPKCFKRPHSQASLEALLMKKLKQLFAFEKSDLKESMIIKWSRRKRDHVDELLVVESQSEEAEWTNYDLDELLVKEEVTSGLLDMLIEETAICLQEIFAKRQAI